MHSHPVIPASVLREAAAWFASLVDAAATEEDKRRWQAWMAADPEHARAWRRVEEVMGQFIPFSHAGCSVRTVLVAPRRRRVLGVLSLLAIAGAGGAALMRLPWQEWRDEAGMGRADYRTGMGRIASTTLPDGTRVWLGGDGVLDMDYRADLRRLHLYRGDVLVETAVDRTPAARPFVLDTPHGRLRALGTRFSVRADPQNSRIDVFAGAVELTPAEAAQPLHVVHAGEHAVFNRGDLLNLGQASTMREAWTRGMLVADRMRLQDLVSELARWNATPIICDSAVADLQVVGAFPVQDAERILAALASTLAVRIVREEDRVRIVADPGRSATAPGPSAFDTPPRRID